MPKIRRHATANLQILGEFKPTDAILPKDIFLIHGVDPGISAKSCRGITGNTIRTGNLERFR